ncbi:MAG: aldo/keto reductase [Cyanobacteria bacterium P01_F01_bin.56]
MSKLALGTVQFGLPYGVANQSGQVSRQEACQILSTAWEAGLDTLDTAIAYGTSESVLGAIGVSQWRVISKLPPLPEEADIQQWVQQSVHDSLKRLRKESLTGLLLHRAQDFQGDNGLVLHDSLQRLKSMGWIEKVGVSIYSPDELQGIIPQLAIDIVQAPLNVLDRRLIQTGWLPRLKSLGIEVHTRSAFLQGLLLMPPLHRPAYFDRWSKLWNHWQTWLDAKDLTPLAACLGFVFSQASVDRVLVGVDSCQQLREILSIAASNFPSVPDGLSSDDLDLLNPSRWP